MSVDEALLEGHSSYRDSRLGISERFVRLLAGPADTLGVIASPLGIPQRLGWVICHSFGSEQVDLHLTDVAMARGLARAGFPTLRFHCQGYGDSWDYSVPPRPSTQLRDTLDVLEQFPAMAQIDQVGLIGARFGGTVAALAADRIGASGLVLIHPIVSGAKYAAEVLRSRVITEMLGEDPNRAVTADQLKAEMATTGMVNIKGWALHRDVFDELRQVDLLKEVGRLSGRALVFQVTRRRTPSPSLVHLIEKLRSRGAEAELDVISHVAAPNFGYEHFRPVAKDVLGDILEGVNHSLVERTLLWLTAGAAAGVEA